MNLLASLLFICFESYHGNYEAASLQVHAAFDWSRNERKSMHAHRTGIDLNSFSFISCVTRCLHRLIQEFERLQILDMSQVDKFSTEEHLRLKDEKIVANMPTGM